MENRRIRVAMLGFGGIAKSHKRGYEELAAKGAPIDLVAICDINPKQFESAQAINLDTGAPKYDLSRQTLYTDLDEMLKNEDFEMVDICLPSYLHHDYAIRMLRAGKNVLCEKPMALSSADCREMIDVAHECGKRLMIGQCLRFEPMYLFLKDAIDDGRFGRVRYAFFERLSAMPRWGFECWYRDTARSGGAILDLHIHDVDMIRFLFGEPREVSATAYDTSSRWTVINSRFRYDGDMLVSANASWDESPKTKFAYPYRVRFEKAEVMLENGHIMVYPDEGEIYEAKPAPANRMAAEIEFLAMSILNDTENLTNPPESAMKTVELVEALRKSADKRGEWVMF